MHRDNFTAYETMPTALAIYMSHNGAHFNKKCCEFALDQMYIKEDEEFKPFSKQQVDGLLESYKVTVKNNKLYDTVYVANMGKADYYNKSIPDDKHLAQFIKDTLDDPDAIEGTVFNRWIADMKWFGIPIPWEDFI